MARKSPPAATTSATPPASPPKPVSLLSKLKSAAAPAKPPTPASSKQRQVMQCEGKEIEVLDNFASADSVLKVTSANHSAAKQQAYGIFKRKHLLHAVRAGFMPENPTIQSPSSRANLVVKHSSKFKALGSDGAPLDVAKVLTEMGFGEHVINEIVGVKDGDGTVIGKGIIRGKESLGLKKFTDLMDDSATPEQKAAAEKVMGLIAEHLTDAEKTLVLEAGIVYEVDDSWQDRAVQIAIGEVNKNDPNFEAKATDRLEDLFRVIPPQFVLSQMNFSGDIQETFRQMASPVAASADPVVSNHPDGKYRAKIIGTEVQLFIVKPDGDELVKTKQCKDGPHATNTVKKWWNQPQALADFVTGVDRK